MAKQYPRTIADIGEMNSKVRAEAPGTMDGFDATTKPTMGGGPSLVYPADALRACEEFGGPAQ